MEKIILSDLSGVDPSRLQLLHLDLMSEDSIAAATTTLKHKLPSKGSYIQTAFFAGGILHPERKPTDLNAEDILETFKINVISHLLCIKHFSQFLPRQSDMSSETPISKWVHVSARVGSISDNRLGGWYSYRASKAALNQVIRTFDLHLQTRNTPTICVGVHPGTVRTDLSKDFHGNVPSSKLFEPEYAAEKLADVVRNLQTEQRGRVWDWAGKEVLP